MISVLIFAGIVVLFFTDPAFEREVTFDVYSVKYKWRMFDHSYCNFKSAGHCFSNETNKLNAEIELYRQLVDHCNGSGKIERKLKEVVNTTYRFDMTYSALTNSRRFEMDSLIKYKEQIFRPIILK